MLKYLSTKHRDRFCSSWSATNAVIVRFHLRRLAEKVEDHTIDNSGSGYIFEG